MTIKKRLLNLELQMKDRKKDGDLFVDPMILFNLNKIYGDGSPYIPLKNVSKEAFDKFVMDVLDKVYGKHPENKVYEKSMES